MKLKHLLIPLISSLMVFSISAQDFKAGAQFGLITSQISGDASGGYFKLGLTGGLFVSRDFRGHYSGEFGITYTPKGSKRFLRGAEGEILAEEYKLSLSYIEIPVLFQYSTDSLGLTLEIGPTIGVLLGQEEVENAGQYDVHYGDFHRLEWGIMTGVSKKIGDHLSLSIRASHSVWHVREHPSGASWVSLVNFTFNRGQYNTALMASLKYHFN